MAGELRVIVCQKDRCHVSGEAMVDLKSTLPNRDKNSGLFAHEINKAYVHPYFNGHLRYVDRIHAVLIIINAVDFDIIESVPLLGIITCSTRFSRQPPMNADDSREPHEEQDMPLPRRLQQEEDARGANPFLIVAACGSRRVQGLPIGVNNLSGPHTGANGAAGAQFGQRRHEITHEQTR